MKGHVFLAMAYAAGQHDVNTCLPFATGLLRKRTCLKRHIYSCRRSRTPQPRNQMTSLSQQNSHVLRSCNSLILGRQTELILIFWSSYMVEVCVHTLKSRASAFELRRRSTRRFRSTFRKTCRFTTPASDSNTCAEGPFDSPFA